MRTLLVMLVLGALPTALSAQEVVEPPPAESTTTDDELAPVQDAPQTVPADLGFGQQGVSRRFEFPDPKRFQARVDRRDEIDASSDRTIIWPTAHTPDKHTLAISNHMLVLTQVSYSPTDDVQLTGSLVVPFDAAANHVALSGKITVSESDNHIFSIQPFGQYHRAAQEFPNTDAGLGVAALLDLISTNNLVLSFGLVGYVTVVAGTKSFSYDDCETRQDFIDGTCRTAETDNSAFPSGGHFLGGQVGATWYIFDSWSLRAELMTGVASGSVLGSEWLTRRTDVVTESTRFREGGVEVGIPFDTDITAGMGFQWSNGMFAVQFSGYILSAPTLGTNDDFRQVYLMPMLNGGMAFF